MGLLSIIKSALGLGDSSGRSGGTDVTVEREADATTERSVKESDPGETSTETARADASITEETTPRSADSGGTEADSPGGDETVEASDAPIEGGDDSEPAGGESDAAGDDSEPADGESAAAGGESAAAGGDFDAAGGEPVEDIKGIGPTYAERLSEAGIHTVADLSATEATALADETDLGEGRLETWIERAKAR